MTRKNFAGVAIFALSALLVSGCGIGFNTGTETQQNSGNGRTANAGALQVRNAVVVVDPKDLTRASLVMTLVNTSESDDELNGVAAAKTVGTEGAVSVALPHKQAVSIGYGSDVTVVLTSVSGALEPGMFVNLTLMFKSGESIPMSLLVEANDGIYSDVKIPAAVTPVENPAPTAVPSPSAS
jgi:copper(I)-binding protein